MLQALPYRDGSPPRFTGLNLGRGEEGTWEPTRAQAATVWGASSLCIPPVPYPGNIKATVTGAINQGCISHHQAGAISGPFIISFLRLWGPLRGPQL
jgi:hypothetical protein